MDHRKLDAALSAALEDVADAGAAVFGVFIHLSGVPAPEDAPLLRELGLEAAAAPGRGGILTATLSAGAIDKLSERPWVQALKLSRKLRPI